MPTCVITDYLFPDTEVENAILAKHGITLVAKPKAQGDDLKALVAEADAVITQFARLDAGVLGAMKKAKVIARYGVGVDNIDLEAAKARGIPVCNVPDYCVDEVADHALGMILETTRRLAQTGAVVRMGEWRMPVPLTAMRALRDLTAGVVGYGRIGRAVAKRLVAFGGTVLVADPFAKPEAIKADGCVPASLDELLAKVDVITLHCPSTATTRKLLNAESLKKTKPGLLVVNVGRGDLIDTGALVAALASGQVAAAGLDVCDPEPVPAGHPLHAFPQVLMTPHNASCSPRAALTLRESTAMAAVRALTGQPLQNVVNGVLAARAAT